jgi:hypothetical protein
MLLRLPTLPFTLSEVVLVREPKFGQRVHLQS